MPKTFGRISNMNIKKRTGRPYGRPRKCVCRHSELEHNKGNKKCKVCECEKFRWFMEVNK